MTGRFHAIAAIAVCLIFATLAFSTVSARQADGADALPKPASSATLRHHERTTAGLPWNDREDFDLAGRGFVAAIPGRRIVNADGKVIRDLSELDIFDGKRPDTVNPSLWRNARLLSRSGLFKVTDRVYQVRGIELANLTVVIGDTGYIVVDCLTTVESAQAAMALVRAKLGDKPVVGIIYTHSHIDHFGGAAGVVTAGEAAARP